MAHCERFRSLWARIDINVNRGFGELASTEWRLFDIDRGDLGFLNDSRLQHQQKCLDMSIIFLRGADRKPSHLYTLKFVQID
jgi:hypothetical protein